MLINTVTINEVLHWSVKFRGEYWNTPVTDNSLQGLMNIIYMTNM